MIEIAKAHSVAAAIELPAFELPDVQNIYMTSLPVAQALQPEVFSFWDRDAVEGQDYKVIGYDKVQSLVGNPGWKYFNFWFNQKFCVRPVQAKFFRFYQSGNDVQIMLHRAPDRSHIIALNESSWANTWQTMAFNSTFSPSTDIIVSMNLSFKTAKVAIFNVIQYHTLT
jgi:hypothetical protein